MKRVLAAGRKFQPRGYRNEVRDYPQFMLLAVLSGELWIERDGALEIATPPTVVLLTPGVDVTLSSPRTGYHGFFVEGVPAECDLPPAVFRFRADSALLRTLADLEEELRGAGGDDDHTPALYSLLLARALRRCRPPTVPRGAALADRIDALLRAHLHHGGTLGEILAPLGLSLRHLGRVFRAERGMSIKRRQLALRVEAARGLLRHPRAAVTTVALDLGFASSQHLATCFRAATGLSPRAWRARHAADGDGG